MTFFLNTETVRWAFNELIKEKIDNSSILHTCFILRACGFDKSSFKSVNLIKEIGLEPARKISGLFYNDERLPKKYDFIDPFSMQSWGASEPLTKWVNSRVKNNVIGGATTWRKIIDLTPDSSEIKFKYNYIDEIIKLTTFGKKINYYALTIWANRFAEFEKETTIVQLANLFKKQFNLEDQEVDKIFTKNPSGLKIGFQSKVHNTVEIRSLIGSPPGVVDDSWVNSINISSDIHNQIIKTEEISMSDFQNKSTPLSLIHI